MGGKARTHLFKGGQEELRVLGGGNHREKGRRISEHEEKRTRLLDGLKKSFGGKEEATRKRSTGSGGVNGKKKKKNPVWGYTTEGSKHAGGRVHKREILF